MAISHHTAPYQSSLARQDGAAKQQRPWRAIGIGFLLVMLLMGLALSVIDEPLRAYAESEFNRLIPSHRIHIGALHFHPIGLSLDLEDVTVVQNAHPDPPVLQLAQWHMSLHWGALFSGTLVSDHTIERPVVHMTRPQASKEASEPDAQRRSWQEAVHAIYPLAINEIIITKGELTYRENEQSNPLHASHVKIRVTNIRNVRSLPDEYPSAVHAEAVLFKTGTLVLDGHADFLAEPHMGIAADVRLEEVDLAHVLPLTSQRQVFLTQGTLSAQGRIEYAPGKQVVHLADLHLQGLKVDYVHAKSTAPKEQATARQVAQSAERASHHPTLLLRIDKGRMEESEFGFVDESKTPAYRVFLSDTQASLDNWSNQLTEGTATVHIRGLFMGTGETRFEGAFRPETESPDFSLSLRIVKAQVKSLSNLLRAHGGVGLVSGVFSVFAEMTVKHNEIDGYVKPLFKDVKANDPSLKEDGGLLKKIYSRIIDAASELLKNTPRGEVAALSEVSGPVENPRASTWELVVTLIQNAFFEAVLPGFEKSGKKS